MNFIQKLAIWNKMFFKKNILDIKSIDLIVYDFDGVMTDNTALVSDEGKESASINRSDGLAVGMIKKLRIRQIILSTEPNPIVKYRAEKLGLEVIYDSKDKKQDLKKFCNNNSINLDRVVYAGNDINDLEAMKIVGFPIAPRDAYIQILNIAKFITKAKGGNGVVREIYGYLK